MGEGVPGVKGTAAAALDALRNRREAIGLYFEPLKDPVKGEVVEVVV
jgi:hypothetical protein